jgi:RNA polymerase sigma-70 factor (ECF subfamily)
VSQEPLDPTDDELVRQVLAGDRERFSTLVERYQTRLVNYLYRIVRSLDDAHDLAQEVFIRVYQALDRYDSQYRFSTWLFRVAQNAAIDVLRKRRVQLVPISRRADDGGDPVPDLELAYEEIADLKGMPLGTVKNKLFRARQMLKQHLKPN